MKFSIPDFDRAYDQALSYLRPYIENRTMQIETARLDLSMHPDRWNLDLYLKASKIRFRRLIMDLNTLQNDRVDDQKWLEVGCLYPALPIALALLGFKVTIAENFSFYPNSFIKMFKVVSKEFRIEFLDVDMDLQKPHLSPRLLNSFDHCSCLAVIEHLPNTPRYVLQNIWSLLRPGGSLYCEVPNFYYWGNVLKMFKGEHMQQPIEILYNSEPPFVGHHREYTLTDLRYVIQESGFQLKTIQRFNYSIENPFHPVIIALLWPALLLNRFKEVILVRCQKV
jgi:SAM-dependent methyltransferase